jgi:hypothetical protein
MNGRIVRFADPEAIGGSSRKEGMSMSGSTIKVDGKEHAALELLRMIMATDAEQAVKKDRAYYLRLMADCIRAVNGETRP